MPLALCGIDGTGGSPLLLHPDLPEDRADPAAVPAAVISQVSPAPEGAVSPAAAPPGAAALPEDGAEASVAAAVSPGVVFPGAEAFPVGGAAVSPEAAVLGAEASAGDNP